MTGAEGQARSPDSVVRIPLPRDDGTLTPYTYETGYALMTLIYDTLLWRDAEGVPQPWLARSIETSEDQRRVTVRLSDGVRWHDGTPLTAEDVAFTFGFVADHPHPRFTAEVAEVDRVDVVDPLTVEINLRRPVAGFSDQPLADLPILPAHIWSALPPGMTAPEGLPMGSGPYRLVAHRPAEAYEFEANDDYFKGRPAVDRVIIPIIPKAQDTLNELRRGGVDMVPANLPSEQAEQLTGLLTRVIKGPLYSGTVVMFNLRTPPFDRVEVRRAVAGAIDLERVARAIGESVAADQGYLYPDSNWASRETLHRFDEGAARTALAPLNLPALEILAPEDDPQRVEAARQVALALERIGLSATSKAIPDAELSSAVGEDGSVPTFQIAIWRAPALASYDPGYLSRLFGSRPPGPSLNYSGYANPTFDSVMDQVSTVTEPEERQGLVDAALTLLNADAPVVPLYFATGIYGIRPEAYDGWVFVRGSGILDKRSFVEPSPGLGQPEESPPTTLRSPASSEGSGLPLLYLGLGLIVLAAGVTAVLLRRR